MMRPAVVGGRNGAEGRHAPCVCSDPDMGPPDALGRPIERRRGSGKLPVRQVPWWRLVDRALSLADWRLPTNALRMTLLRERCRVGCASGAGSRALRPSRF